MAAAHDSLLYARVETVLAGEIIDGDLKVGEQLPTEDSLIAAGLEHLLLTRCHYRCLGRNFLR
jgi:hypothetical protein